MSWPNPKILRKENVELFNINSTPLSSNMIALICSAVSSSSLALYTFSLQEQIVVALDEAAKGNATVNFDEKTYAPL